MSKKKIDGVVGRQSREYLKTITKDLRCKLTLDEQRDRGRQLAVLESEVRQKEEEKKAVARRLKDELDELKMRQKDKAYDVRSGTEERPVECDWIADFLQDKAELVRRDTGEVIKTRDLTDDDRQAGLAL